MTVRPGGPPAEDLPIDQFDFPARHPHPSGTLMLPAVQKVREAADRQPDFPEEPSPPGLDDVFNSVLDDGLPESTVADLPIINPTNEWLL